jgi:hypothetical protein
MPIEWIVCNGCGDQVEIGGIVQIGSQPFCFDCYKKRSAIYGDDVSGTYDHYDAKHHWVKGTGRLN